MLQAVFPIPCCWLPTSEGALLVLISDPTYPPLGMSSEVRIPVRFSQLFTTLEVADHQRALIGYLPSYNLPIVYSGHRIIATTPHGIQIVGKFDTQGRLLEMTTTNTLQR
ncbi:MAG: hypothetical protein HC876_07990 [Chloroflexaceae bacterium]|nr:hypothetical protein [Chloroflexaceae bacterium]